MNKPNVIVHIQEVNWTTVIEVPGIFGDPAGVAARLRSEGLAAKKVGDIVIVNANAEFTKKD